MWNEIQSDKRTLNRVTEQMRTDGLAYAKAEAEYQSVKARRVLELRSEGESAAMINLRIKGDEEVNSYFMARECARVIYETDREQINTLKTNIRIMENQLSREWSS